MKNALAARLGLASLFLMLAASSAGAQGWAPPTPAEDGRDWILLTSGEWVTGQLDMMENGKAYFDSREFDDIKIDIADIAEMRSPNRHTYRLVGRRIYTGTAMVKDGQIKIDTGSDVLEFETSQIVSMIAGEPRELNYWSANAGLGFTAKTGNSETTDFTATAEIRRRTPLTRFAAQYTGAFSSASGVDTANNNRVFSFFDYFFTKRLFLRTPSLEYYTDPFTNINTRLTTGISVGYEILDASWLLWEVAGGMAYTYTDLISVQSGSTSSNDAALLLSTKIETDPTDMLEWDTTYSVNVVVTDTDKTNHNLNSVLSFDIWGPLDLDLTFIFDRIENPEVDASGIKPKSNDFRMTVGLAFDI